MRFNLLARRIMAPALGLALAATVAACSSSGSSATTSSSSASSPAAAGSSAAPSSSGGGNAVAQITANWEKFFDSGTPLSEKATVLQDGNVFEGAIRDFADFPLASGLKAKVTNVTLNSATSATVKYDLTANGQGLLSGQTGTAVLQGGTWKVGDASLCGLFKRIPGGTLPSACKSVG